MQSRLSPLEPEEYVEKLAHLMENCKARGVSFSRVVLKALSSCLGPSSAQAVVYHIGPDCLSSPMKLVSGLSRVFGQGASVILQEITSSEPTDSNALEETTRWRA